MTEPLLITASEPAALVDAILEQRTAGKGWINIVPEIPPEVPLPATPGPLAVFSKRGPVVPMATIMTARHRDPAQLGIQHGAASQVLERLGPLPEGWRKLQDNAKRGLVIALAPDTSAGLLAEWTLSALATLCIPPRTARFAVFRFDT